MLSKIIHCHHFDELLVRIRTILLDQDVIFEFRGSKSNHMAGFEEEMDVLMRLKGIWKFRVDDNVFLFIVASLTWCLKCLFDSMDKHSLPPCHVNDVFNKPLGCMLFLSDSGLRRVFFNGSYCFSAMTRVSLSLNSWSAG